MKLHRDLKEFLVALGSNEVRFLIVGGGAVNAHGYVRTTEDFDFWIARDRDNAGRLLKAIEQFGFSACDLTVDELLEPGQVFVFGRPPNRIDILTSITGVEFEAAWARREYGELDGVRMPIISLEDLLINKRMTGRYKDLADVEEFERSRKYGKQN